MTTDDKKITIDNLAKAIAGDISNLAGKAARGGKLKNVRDIDLNPLLKGGGAENVRAVTNSLRSRAEESSKKTRAETTKISEQVETSVQKRQIRLKTNMDELSKTPLKDDAEAKIILNRVAAELELKAIRLEEIRIEKEIKPVIRRFKLRAEK